jgi:hypothetical protein
MELLARFPKPEWPYNLPMPNGLAAMTIALRVLRAITDRQLPSQEDITELRRLAPLFADRPPDELACEVIQLQLKNRSEARSVTRPK